ncbi:hypothetical protein [Microseira sp. BLCC-F43]|jgi:hypothetical protein|uniref:hypothetical protein n=1 Tax=Microseira sp. BLCC-F43 TaxID=3153602 RepID=UPI0035B70E40
MEKYLLADLPESPSFGEKKKLEFTHNGYTKEFCFFYDGNPIVMSSHSEESMVSNTSDKHTESKDSSVSIRCWCLRYICRHEKEKIVFKFDNTTQLWKLKIESDTIRDGFDSYIYESRKIKLSLNLKDCQGSYYEYEYIDMST